MQDKACIGKKCFTNRMVLLTFVWHTMYSWDRALEHLYHHICELIWYIVYLFRWTSLMTLRTQIDRYWDTEDQSGPPYYSSESTPPYIAPRWRQEDGWIHSQTQESSDGFRKTDVRERAEWHVPGTRTWPFDSRDWSVDQGFRNAVVSFDKCDRSSMFSL